MAFNVAEFGIYENGLALQIVGGVKLLESVGVGLTVTANVWVLLQPLAVSIII